MWGSVADCVPGASLRRDAGFAEQGRPASGQGASILVGKQRGQGGWEERPVLSPDVISPPWGGSTAKGRALLTLAAPGSLAGALVIWAVAGGGVCQGSPQAKGTRGLGQPALLGCCQGKKQRDGGRDGWEGGFGAHSPLSPSSLPWGGGRGQR